MFYMVGVAGTEAGIMRKYGEFIELAFHKWKEARDKT